jgi:hypothetical protein
MQSTGCKRAIDRDFRFLRRVAITESDEVVLPAFQTLAPKGRSLPESTRFRPSAMASEVVAEHVEFAESLACLDAWSSVNLKLAFIFFETTFKELEREALGNDEVLPCYRSTRTRLPDANSQSCIAVMIST